MTTEFTTAALPAPLARYFAAQAERDIDALAACFSAEARVRDEGHEHVGRAAIRAWMEAARAKYSFTAEPLSTREEGGRRLVVARVSGNFPGSPVELTYRFSLSVDGEISALEIG